MSSETTPNKYYGLFVAETETIYEIFCRQDGVIKISWDNVNLVLEFITPAKTPNRLEDFWFLTNLSAYACAFNIHNVPRISDEEVLKNSLNHVISFADKVGMPCGMYKKAKAEL